MSAPDEPDRPGPPGGVGRRAARGPRSGGGRAGALRALLLALLLPAAGVGLAALAEDGPPPVPRAAPDSVPLPAADLGCAALPPGPSRDGRPPVLASRAPGFAVERDARGAAATTVSARGAAAPGLLAARAWGPGGWAPCAPPVPEVWVAGAGAGAEHATVVELVNPDAGDAVVDLTVLGPDGPLTVDAVRGVRVPGRSSVPLDLAALAPNREQLAVQVVVARGRAAVQVRDVVDPLGREPATVDLAPVQAAPVEEVLLLGLPEGRGERLLTVANPGEDQVRVELAVVGERSTFVPVGLAEVGDLEVAPGSTASVDLGPVLAREADRGALGLRVRASGPVVASLRQVLGGDLVHAAPAAPVTSSAVLLPDLPRRSLVLAGSTTGATGATGETGADAEPVTTRVVVRDAAGRVVRRLVLDVAAGAGVRVPLPARAARVDVTTDAGAGVRGALVATSAGAARPAAVVQPLAPLATTALLPQVRPAG